MSFNASYIVNDHIPVKPKQSVGVIKESIRFNGELEKLDRIDLFETSKSVVIDHLEVSTNSKDCRIAVGAITNQVAKDIGILPLGGGELMPVTPNNINEHLSSTWKNIVFDKELNLYKFSITTPIEFPTGCRLVIRNGDAKSIKCSLQGFYREVL